MRKVVGQRTKVPTQAQSIHLLLVLGESAKVAEIKQNTILRVTLGITKRTLE